MRPDRIVIGVDDGERPAKLMKSLYAPFMRNKERLFVMDVKSAELTKYAANAMLATRISFMNELANLADAIGADIESVRMGIGADARIGQRFLYAGCGYGGSCFPKDVQALQRTASVMGVELGVVNAVEEANNRQKQILLKKITSKFGENLSGLQFALWGLAFKPDTDDMREAPSRVLIEELWSRGAVVSAYDPVAQDEARRIYGVDHRLKLCESALSALSEADALVIVTEWKEFRSVNFETIYAALRKAVIFDGRNLYNPSEVRAAGLEYYSIGRK